MDLLITDKGRRTTNTLYKKFLNDEDPMSHSDYVKYSVLDLLLVDSGLVEEKNFRDEVNSELDLSYRDIDKAIKSLKTSKDIVEK